MNNIIKLDDSKYNNLFGLGSEILNKVLHPKFMNFDYKKCANVNTIIFYLRKDSTLKSSNFLYKENTNIHNINISKNNILLMRGDLIHKPQDIDDYDRRESIVVRI
jgi:hypothetical protein